MGEAQKGHRTGDPATVRPQLKHVRGTSMFAVTGIFQRRVNAPPKTPTSGPDQAAPERDNETLESKRTPAPKTAWDWGRRVTSTASVELTAPEATKKTRNQASMAVSAGGKKITGHVEVGPCNKVSMPATAVRMAPKMGLRRRPVVRGASVELDCIPYFPRGR